MLLPVTTHSRRCSVRVARAASSRVPRRSDRRWRLFNAVTEGLKGNFDAPAASARRRCTACSTSAVGAGCAADI